MNVREKIITGAGCIAFTALLCLTLKVISFILIPKDDINNSFNVYEPFFKEKTGFDVLFFGTSHVACDVSPMDLWNDYGTTSYNFGNSGEPQPITYWTMKLALRHSIPKLVVVDAYYFALNEWRKEGNAARIHNALDIFPLSKIKINAILDLIDEEKDRFEYIFPGGKYHTRWTELTETDFRIKPSRDKGIWAYGYDHSLEFLTVSKSQPENEIIYTKKALDENAPPIVYLKKMIEFCQAKNIDIVLTMNPYRMDVDTQMMANGLHDFAERYGIRFINFVQMNNIVDFSVDMMDWGHTNPSGMKKITDYLGDYLTNHFELEDHRTDEKYQSWWNDYHDFLNLKVETFWGTTELSAILELLHDKDFNYTVEVTAGSDILNQPNVMNLMQNITRDHIYENTSPKVFSKDLKPLQKIEEAAEKRLGYVLSVDNANGTFSETILEDNSAAEAPNIRVRVTDRRINSVVADIKQ